MEKLNKLCSIILFIALVSCKNDNNINMIKSNDTIKNDSIREMNLDRGIITLDNKYLFTSACFLIYKDSFPNWIKDKGKPDFSLKEYKFKPVISDIDPPYVLFKNKSEPYFYIIKHNDTLKFKLVHYQ